MQDINESPVKGTVQQMFKLFQTHGNSTEFWIEAEKLIKAELSEVVDLKAQLAAKDARIEALEKDKAALAHLIYDLP